MIWMLDAAGDLWFDDDDDDNDDDDAAAASAAGDDDDSKNDTSARDAEQEQQRRQRRRDDVAQRLTLCVAVRAGVVGGALLRDERVALGQRVGARQPQLRLRAERRLATNRPSATDGDGGGRTDAHTRVSIVNAGTRIASRRAQQ